MREFDRLPVELRLWLAAAALPWRPRSVQRAYKAAFAKTWDKASALAELDRLEARLLAKDAAQVWGQAHPCAALGSAP